MPEKQGFLIKQGHIVRNWKKRWFILQGKRLFYFEDIPSESSQPLGDIPFGNCTVRSVGNPKVFMFEVLNWITGKDFLLQAESEEDKMSWMNELRCSNLGEPRNYTLSVKVVKQEIEFLQKLQKLKEDKVQELEKSANYQIPAQLEEQRSLVSKLSEEIQTLKNKI